MPDEVETMFYAGETPWHGLGTRLDNIATAEEAIVAAELDWEVELLPCYLRKDSRFRVVADRRVLARKGDGMVYNVVSDRYVPVQNREAFSFFDLVTGTGDAKYHTAGSLKEGGIIWMLAKLDGSNGSISIKGEQVDKFLLLTNSHNGYFALQMFWTPIRVVCMNTLNMALSKDAERFYARHTTNISERMEAAREILGLANQFYSQWKEQAEWLATHSLPPAQVPLLLNAAFGYEEDIPADQVYITTKREMEKVVVLMETGRGMDNPAIRGTRWAAYNAVAEYVDYTRQYRKDRLYGTWFGGGNDIKKRAWSWLLKS